MTSATTSVRGRLMREEEPEWMVWALVIVMLAIGLFLGNSTTNQTANISQSGVSLTYPLDWATQTGTDPLIFIADSSGLDAIPTSVLVEEVKRGTIGRNLTALSDLALGWSAPKSRSLTAFSTLGVDTKNVAGREAMMIEYAYVSTDNLLPEVVRARTYLVPRGDYSNPTDDDVFLVITLAGSSATFADHEALWSQILGSLQVQ